MGKPKRKFKKTFKRAKNLASDSLKVTANNAMAPLRTVGIKKAHIPPSKFHNQKFGKFTTKVADVVNKTAFAVTVGAVGGAALAAVPTLSEIAQNNKNILPKKSGSRNSVIDIKDKFKKGKDAAKETVNTLVDDITEDLPKSVKEDIKSAVKGDKELNLEQTILDGLGIPTSENYENKKSDSNTPTSEQSFLEMILQIPLDILNSIFGK